MSLEIIRAIVLFAIGDPVFRAQLVENPEEALISYDLSVDDRLLLNGIRFDGPIAFDDEQLLEQLLGSVNTGWPGAGGFGGLAGGSGLLGSLGSGGFMDLMGLGLSDSDDPDALAGLEALFDSSSFDSTDFGFEPVEDSDTPTESGEPIDPV